MTNKNYYVVLNDGETYSSVEGTFIVLLKDDGESQLDLGGDISSVSDNNVFKKVYISDLVDCWIMFGKHGSF